MPKRRQPKAIRTRKQTQTKAVKFSQSSPVLNRSDRRHKTTDTHHEQRNSFERDRDRVLYCSAFRRLAGVTQVVRAAEGHVFHNRLTHTLKVAQTARRLAEQVIRTQPKELIAEIGDIDPDVVETAALAHDLGHPPFGHLAEDELNSQLNRGGIADGFEGNAQSFRIVTWVALKGPTFQGLNLTRASLNGILKYPWPRAVDGKESKKWGYYFSEKEDFDFARELGSPGDRVRAQRRRSWTGRMTLLIQFMTSMTFIAQV